MAEFINTSTAIGDDALVDSIITRTITEYKENRVTKLRRSAFAYCAELAVVDMPSITEIGLEAFENCSALVALILRGDTMCTLGNVRSLGTTPIASGTGYIYVPRALLSDTDATKDYRRATNWSTYSAQFRALEDYTVDGTVDGELDETKIAA